MKKYLTWSEMFNENEGRANNEFYHKGWDRYVIFDSQEEYEQHKNDVVRAQVGGYDRPVTLLNTSILTAFGNYEFRPLSLDEARARARRSNFQSAIGHQATAEILSELLDLHVTFNRIQYVQPEGHMALVFKLKGRVPEGTILSRQQIDEIGYDFGLLTRLADNPDT